MECGTHMNYWMYEPWCFADQMYKEKSKKGMTYKELSRRTGISERALLNYLARRQIPSLDKAIRIWDALGFNTIAEERS